METTNGVASSPSPPTTTVVDTPPFPNWLDLPSDLIHSILNLISFSIPDLLTFSSVCNLWRSLSKSSSSKPPPLLLCFTNIKNQSLSWRLKPLLDTRDDPRSFKPSSISDKLLMDKNLLGSSHGHLIFGSVYSPYILIADIFSCNEFRVPTTSSLYHIMTVAILTAPVTSPSCMLLVGGLTNELLCCRLGANDDTEWSVVELPLSHCIHCMVVLSDGKVVCLLTAVTSLVVFESFFPRVSWKELKVRFCGPRGTVLGCQYLVECNKDLLLVRFSGHSSFKAKIQVYRMDFEKLAWVAVQSIGDWCLFKDGTGKGLMACPYPTRWGGRSNCMYVAQPLTGIGIGNSAALPLDGTPFHKTLIPCGRSPSSLWVYPSTLL